MSVRNVVKVMNFHALLHVNNARKKIEKAFNYELCFDFEDKANDSICTGFNLDVDLSEHTEELKKLIIKAMIDKFF